MKKTLALLLLFAGAMFAQSTSLLYRASIGSLATASAMDIASSWGHIEANPVLGWQFGPRALAVKTSVTVGGAVFQYLYMRKHPEKQRLAAFVNIAASGVIIGVSIRNFRMR